MPHFFSSIGSSNALPLIAVGLLLLIYGVCAYRNGRRARNLKQCCTVPVDAVCTGKRSRRTGFREDGAFNVLYRYETNCSYRFEYMGRIYDANNDVWSGMHDNTCPREGDRVRLLIDPSYPDSEILDPVAERDVSNSMTALILFVGAGALVMLIPVFQHFDIYLF